MKKFFILMTMAALAIPALQAKEKTEPTKFTRNGDYVMPASTLMLNETWNSKITANKAEIKIWDFEDESQIADWTFIDSDNDGFNWQYFNMTGVESGRMTPYEGEGLMASASYDKDASLPLFPDNWMISPQVELEGTLSFWAAGQDPSYAAEVFAVYACIGTPTDITDFVKISDDIVATGTYTKYEFNLHGFEGQTGCFAIRHYNVTDMFWLNVDYITLDPTNIQLVAPTDVTVDPTATTAEVSWTDNNDAESWNIRYIVYNSGDIEPMTFDFSNEAQAEQWTVVDADGDGYNWGLENGAMMSGSYINGTAVDPDNWLISPAFKLGGSVKFKAWNYSSYYPEQFAVYVFEGDTWTNVSEFVNIADNLVPGVTTNPTEYEYDLSNYTGNGYIAFRNYGTHDEWRMYIDDVELIPSVEWTYVIGETENPATIEGLTPETTYAIQIQAAAGDATGPWSDLVTFTTLAESAVETPYYVVGGFNSWSQEDGMVEIGEEGATITVEAQDLNDPNDESQEFKIITPNGTDWIWFGGVDDNGVGFFDLSNDLLGVDITLDDEGSNFRLPEAGTYNIKLIKDRNVIEGMTMVVTKEAVTAVNDINAKNVVGIKYVNIAGMKSDKPFDGVNIVVTTYTDGTQSTTKVIK